MKLITTLFLAFFTIGSQAQTPTIQKQAEWFRPGYIIQGVAIGNKGDQLAFVKRLQTDTIEAGTTDDRGVDNLLNPKADTARRRDPVVVVYDLKSRRETLLDYGWAPRFSPNDQRIAYAHQLKPVTGTRIVAETFTGNNIRVFEWKTKKAADVISVPRGFLMDPVFSDSATIIYKTGDAVNGPYAAGISLHSYNLVTKTNTLLRGARIQHRLYDLMGEVYGSGAQYSYTVYSPQDSAQGLANEYSHLLMRGNDTLHNFGIRHYSNLDFKFALLPQDQLVYLDDNHLMTEDTSFIVTYHSGKMVSRKPISFEFTRAWLSPEGSFLFYTNNDQESFILRISDFSKMKLPLGKKEIHSVVWADKGRQLAVVQDHETLPGTDQLYLFSVN
ncbi:hypothetical protein [Niabella beijingensis]|uniref:hypothetical protein n=1 Tax=Niabella beijingensis TaxID=2872700 RepID=UPI001CBC79F6|nr:hypothetical protein [Niabella beijingensis]MBZ4189797.1 hypothetical protein [Niabella beijingensis]